MSGIIFRRKIGGRSDNSSLFVNIPMAIVETLSLRKGEELMLEFDGEKIILSKNNGDSKDE